MPGQLEFMSMNGRAAAQVVCCLQSVPSGLHAGQSVHGSGHTLAHESHPGPVLQSYLKARKLNARARNHRNNELTRILLGWRIFSHG